MRSSGALVKTSASPDLYLGPAGSYPSYNSTGGTAPTFLSDRVRFNPGAVSETSASCQYIDFGAQTWPMATTGFSIAIKFQFTGTPGFFEHFLSINIASPYFELCRNTNTDILIMGYYNPAQNELADFGAYAQNTTYTVIAIYDPTVGAKGTLYEYKNGSLNASLTVTNAALASFTSTNTYIGTSKNAGNGALNADIFYAAFYKRVLTSGEIASITASGPVFGSSVISMFISPPAPLFNSISSGASASATGIFSLYAINGTNPLVINVRNGTTSATSDFYGSTTGTLTTSGGQSISSWLAGATGYIATWYDQSGLGNHAVQATTGNQPSITLGTPNLIDFSGSKYFTAANQIMPTGNGVFTTITKLGTHGTSVQIGMWGFGTTGSSGCVGLDLRTDYSPNRYEEFFYGTGDVTGLTYTPNATVSGVYNQTAHTLYLNGTQIGTSAVSSRNGIAGNQYIGAINFVPPDNRGLLPYNGTMKDLYIFSTVLSTTDRNTLENGYTSSIIYFKNSGV